MAIDMLAAIFTTKTLILIRSGFRAGAHEARADWSMLFCTTSLALVGVGAWSLDTCITPET
jgi:hypothetical protein